MLAFLSKNQHVAAMLSLVDDRLHVPVPPGHDPGQEPDIRPPQPGEPSEIPPPVHDPQRPPEIPPPGNPDEDDINLPPPEEPEPMRDPKPPSSPAP